MKKLRFFVCILLIICMCAAFSGCGEPSLSAPSNLRVNGDTLNLSWRAVPNARYYTVSINDDSKDVRSNSYSLANLAAGEYELKVKACSTSSDYRDSGWSETLSFTREPEPGMGFTLINSRTEYEVTSLGTAEGDVVVPDTYRGKPVTSIGDRAFTNRNKLTGVTLGPNIRRIGEQAFYNCSYLTKVNLPESLTEIGAQAFQSCRLLNCELVIPSGITRISDYAFAYCRNLTSVTIGGNVTEIGDYAFADCNKLASVIIPDNVESIGDYAFSGCNSATYLSLGNGVSSVGERAFYGCTALQGVNFGSRLTEIGNYAFADCTSLTEIVLPESLAGVGDGAFNGCASANRISMGDGVQKVGIYSFSNTKYWDNCENLVYVGKWLVDAKSEDKTTYEASEFRQDMYGVAGRVFSTDKALTSVTLPNSVQVVGDYAFAGCENLSFASVGSGAKSVGEHAFDGCAKLAILRLGLYNPLTQTLTSSLESIGSYAFQNCAMLRSDMDIPDTVTYIGTYAFMNTGVWQLVSEGIVYADNWVVGYKSRQGALQTDMVNIQDGTVGISNYAFYQAFVDSVTVPESVKHIGRGAFYDCIHLKAVFLPSTMTAIEDYTFYRCYELNLTTLPQNITSIGYAAFYKCRKLGTGGEENNGGEVKFVIPDGVRYIGDYAFYGCGTAATDKEGAYGITDIQLGEGVESIGAYAFANFVTLQRATMRNNVQSMGERAFYKCENLKQVTLSERLGQIGARTFYGCTALAAIEIPSGVRYIGDYAFYKCPSLAQVGFNEGLERLGDNVFSGCAALTRLILPSTLKYVGKQTFRGLTNVGSVTLSAGIAEIAVHAFYGCSNLTVYTELSGAPEGWNARWNSTNRPVIWGAELSADKSYVVSIVKTGENLSNVNSMNKIAPPERDGYVFGGWAVEPQGSAVYSAEQLEEAPEGVTLYAVWLS